MKLVAKLLAVAAIAIGLNTHAEDEKRKEAVLDGKYLRIVASAPDFANPPSTYLNRPFTGKGATAESITEYFVHFAAPLAEERTGAMYSARLIETANGKPVPDARAQAEYMMKNEGIEPSKAVEIQVPSIAVHFPDAKVIALRGEGVAYDDPRTGKEVVFTIGVSFPDGKAAYAMAGSVIAPVAAFDADPKKFSKWSGKALTDLVKNSKIERK